MEAIQMVLVPEHLHERTRVAIKQPNWPYPTKSLVIGHNGWSVHKALTGDVFDVIIDKEMERKLDAMEL